MAENALNINKKKKRNNINGITKLVTRKKTAPKKNILFLIYVNDMIQAVESNLNLCTDHSYLLIQQVVEITKTVSQRL